MKRLLLRAGWAPVGVVVAHASLAIITGHQVRADPVFHFLGGAAIAFFLAQAIHTWPRWFGDPSIWSRGLIVFCMATTAAVFWEFMEFLTGGKLGYSQESLPETMNDLLLGCLGAFSYLVAKLAVAMWSARAGSHRAP